MRISFSSLWLLGSLPSILLAAPIPKPAFKPASNCHLSTYIFSCDVRVPLNADSPIPSITIPGGNNRDPENAHGRPYVLVDHQHPSPSTFRVHHIGDDPPIPSSVLMGNSASSSSSSGRRVSSTISGLSRPGKKGTQTDFPYPTRLWLFLVCLVLLAIVVVEAAEKFGKL
jgi:hypothetical protein